MNPFSQNNRACELSTPCSLAVVGPTLRLAFSGAPKYQMLRGSMHEGRTVEGVRCLSGIHVVCGKKSDARFHQ